MTKPAPSDFTSREWRIVQRHRTPAQVQRFIESIRYNREPDGETCFTFRAVLRRNRAHCLEAALTAAVILEQHGYPPLLVSIESQDKLDHVLLLFKQSGRYGSVARSRDLGLHGRKPVFRTVRDLVMSYYDAYVDKTGRITGYGIANLNEDLGSYDWRFSTKNVWRVERLLQDMPHRQINSSNARYNRLHERYLEFKRLYPNRYPDFYTEEDWL
jgi:hypothetical protein